MDDSLAYDGSIKVEFDINWHWAIAFLKTTVTHIELKTGEYTGALRMYVHIPAHGSPYQNNECVLGVFPQHSYSKVLPGTIHIKRIEENKTRITAYPRSENLALWTTLIDDIITFVSEHHDIERVAIGAQFKSILNYYYDAKSQGKKIKLAALAREYGVNYGSLRQAKLRYERQLQANDGAEPDPIVETEPPDL